MITYITSTSAAAELDPPCHDRGAMLLNAQEALEVAWAYSNAPTLQRVPRVLAAYAALESQSDYMFSLITDPARKGVVRVAFTRATKPYASDCELIDAVRKTRLLEVTTVASCGDRLHPLLGCTAGGTYDRFRAVHDILGHVCTGSGFDRQGEYHAWRIQDQQYSGLARLALASELHAEHSVYWTSGQLPEHKAWILEPRLLAWARA
jgi:hypothetical protein